MQTKCDEPIEVLAKFKNGAIAPLIFKFENRAYKVESVDLKYDFMEGSVKHLSYSVGSGANSYKITLNTETMEWRLEEIFTN